MRQWQNVRVTAASQEIHSLKIIAFTSVTKIFGLSLLCHQDPETNP